jgi:hypothetical protein
MQIGIAAKKVGLSVDAIRFYERNALLRRAPRTEGGFRRYGANCRKSWLTCGKNLPIFGSLKASYKWPCGVATESSASVPRIAPF